MLQTRSKLDAQMLLPEWEQTLAHFLRHPVTIRLKDLLAQRQALSCSGLLPSARMLLALACWRDSTTPVLWLTSSSESAERLTADLKTVLRGEFSGCPLHFPEQEEGEGAHIDPIRLGILDQLDHGSCGMIVSSLRALLQTVLSPEQLKRSRFELKKGELVDRDTIIELLSEEGYTRVGMVERRAEFSLRGGILDIYPLTGDPVRLELFGDEIESIRIFDRDSQRSIIEVNKVDVLPARQVEEGKRLSDYLPRGTVVILEEPAQLRLNAMEWSHEGWSGQWGDVLGLLAAFHPVYYTSWSNPSWDAIEKQADALEYACQAQVTFANRVEGLFGVLPQLCEKNSRIVLASLQHSRLRELCDERKLPQGSAGGQVAVVSGSLSEGFRLEHPEGNLEVFSDREITGAVRRRRPTQKAERGSLIRLEELDPGQLVVHLQHGIGRYLGVKSLVVQGNARLSAPGVCER
jgi:transcription-repair coupling factor (superfamily II helicase)